MTDNTPRPSTPAPSEGDEKLAKEIEDLDEISIGRFQDGKWLWATLSEENFDRILAALRRPSYTQGEAMREAIATEIELVFKPLVMGQCISDWSMKQLVDASAVAATRIMSILPTRTEGDVR